MPSAVSALRSKVSISRSDATEPSAESEHMHNLAYVVSSANENIQALQRTVKQQEKELAVLREKEKKE